MKIFITFCFVCFSMISSTCLAQLVGGEHGGINTSFVLTIPEKNANISGSSYLNEEYQYGTVYMEGREPLDAYFRYNVAEEQIEIKIDLHDPQVYLLPRNVETRYKIGSNKFLLDKLSNDDGTIYGYFVELYGGDNFNLMKKYRTEYTPPVKAKTGYDQDRPGRIDIEEDYFVVIENGDVKKVQLKHRDIKKAFRSRRSKDYLSDNRINSEEDLIEFMSFLDRAELE